MCVDFNMELNSGDMMMEGRGSPISSYYIQKCHYIPKYVSKLSYLKYGTKYIHVL